MAAQHIEAIQRQRNITYDKRHKTREFQPCMMVMIQDARKLDFPDKFDAVWLGPYLVKDTFPNNSLQLETLNGDSQCEHPGVGASNTGREDNLLTSKRFGDSVSNGRQLYEPKMGACSYVTLCLEVV